MTSNIGPANITPAPSIHNVLLRDNGRPNPLDPKFWDTTGTVFLELFLAQVALALGNVTILGIKPFAFLTTWGENLETLATDAFSGQQTANNNLAALVDAVLGTGHTFEDLGAALTSGLSGVEGLLSAALDNLDGTAEAWASFLFNGDGTATIEGAISDAEAAVQDFFDGTAQWVSGLLFNSDGTASYGPVLGFHPLRTLIDQLDGTAMAAGAALHNLLNPQGVHTTFTLPSWRDLFANTGLGSGGQLANALKGLLPAALDNLDGTAETLANIVHNFDGTATALTQAASNALTGLVDNFDGTVMSWAHALQSISVGQNIATALSTGQQVGDALANALGHPGTGHTPLQILSYLAAIPAALVAGVTTEEQNLRDAIANAMGHAGTGHTAADILSYLGAIPGTVIASATAIEQSLITSFGTGITDVATAINNGVTALTHILALIAAIPGASLITDVATTINTALNNAQGAIDNIVNTIGGGSGSGNQPTDVANALGQIPHTNVAIPPNGGTGSITHDAFSNGTPVTGTTTTLSMSWSHTIAATANYLIVRVASLTTGTFVSTVTCGGIPMLLLGGNGATGSPTATIQIFILPNPPTGSKTISVQLSGASATIYTLQAEADSYIGVLNATATATSSTNSSPSETLSSVSGKQYCNGIAVTAASSETLSSYSQTSRYNPGSTFNSTASKYLAMIAGDATGTGSNITYSATASFTTTNSWVSAVATLTPLPSAPIGSGFRQYRNSTSSVAGSSGGPNTFAASFFDTNQYNTGDYTWDSIANEVSVTYAGWYMVTVQVVSTPTIAGGQRLAMGVSRISGGVTTTKNGPDFIGTSSGVGASIRAGATFSIYCSAGDFLKATYLASGTPNNFTGSSGGGDTYFEVTLLNRSLH